MGRVSPTTSQQKDKRGKNSLSSLWSPLKYNSLPGNDLKIPRNQQTCSGALHTPSNRFLLHFSCSLWKLEEKNRCSGMHTAQERGPALCV